MDIIDQVAQYITDNTDLVLGDDIWYHFVPESEREGVAVKFVRSLKTFGQFRMSRFAIMLFFSSWSTQQSYLSEIESLFDGRRGYVTVEWSPTGEIEMNNYGIDEYDRFISSIVTDIKHQ